MSRLVAFGCSVTAGQGLPDVINTMENSPDSDPIIRSNLAWPSILSKKLGIDCINNGIPGKGHKFVRWQIQNFNFKKNDIVVVCWPSSKRHCIICKNQTSFNSIADTVWPYFRNIGPWNANDSHPNTIRRLSAIREAYYKYIHYRFDSDVEFFTAIHYTKLYLDSIGISNFHTVSTQQKIIDGVLKWNNVELINDVIITETGKPLALDNLHPGEEAHAMLADALYTHIKNKTTSTAS